MTFAWPHLLWLLLLPAGLLAWELTRRRSVTTTSIHPKILRADVGSHQLSLLREGATVTNGSVRPWFILGLALAIVALARPQWGRIEEPVFDQSREILLAVDLSRSMLSTDVKPSRLDRSKLLIQALLEKLKGERVGLIVFSGTAFLQSPLSADYEILREFLPALNPDYLPEGGTNYGALIDTAIDAFGSSNAADRFLIILSDGEATDEDWQSHVDELKKKGIHVIALGVGTAAGSMIPDGSGGFVKDERGAVVLSKLESGTLQQLAQETGGVYRDASTWIDLASLIEQTVDMARKGKFVEKNTVRYVERFQWPLAFALWCFLISFYYEFPVRPRPRQITLQRGPEANKTGSGATTTAAKVGLVALLLCPLLAWPTSSKAAVKLAPTPGALAAPAPSTTESTPDPAADLTKTVGRLSKQDALSAPDLSEFAHETLNWGRRLKDAGKPVPPGPVNDALQAVDQLEAKGDKLTDWSQLRKDLQELLQKPPPPPPQKQNQKQDQKKDEKQSDQDKQKNDQNQSKSQQNQSKSSDSQKQDQKQSQSSAEKKNESQSQKSEAQKKSDAEKKKSEQSAFGDMTKQPPQQPQPSSEMQKVGGVSEKRQKPPTDPAMAIPLEKLDRLKTQDSPAQLFQMLQGDRRQTQAPQPAKNW